MMKIIYFTPLWMFDKMDEMATPTADPTSNNMDITIGYIGSILMIIGPFLPVASILGFSFDYIGEDGGGDGVIVLLLGIVSLALIRFNKFKILAATSIVVLLIIASFISDISTIISEPEIGAYVILLSALLTGYTAAKNW